MRCNCCYHGSFLQKTLFFYIMSKTNYSIPCIDFIFSSICLKDQVGSILPQLSQLEEGLNTYGLLSSIQQHPTVWEPVFVGGKGQPITASSLIGCFEVQHSNSLVKRDAESDTYTHTFVTSYILE